MIWPACFWIGAREVMRPNQHPPRALVWLRRALRVEDNAVLWQAAQEAEDIVPILVLRSDSAYHTNSLRRRFIRSAIADLDAALRARGTCLHIRVGNPEREIPAAASAYGAGAVYAARLYDESGLRRDARVAGGLHRVGARFVEVQDRVLRESREIRRGDGGPFRVFTPFKRQWLASALDLPRPFSDVGNLAPVPLGAGSLSLDRLPGFDSVVTGQGESDARKRLQKFLRSSVFDYARQRDIPAVDGTSRLSHHLAIGTLSPRQLYWAAAGLYQKQDPRGRAGIDTFISELIWREFYYHIAAAFPMVFGSSFREEFRTIEWRNSSSALSRWKTGTTGYPMIDAAMRQLASEGWMHNRARMIVASFLTKDLHLDWRQGEGHFADQLVDLDLASNNGGWQWTAGTGTDASPWFRIFNPVLQGKKFDPDGTYVRHYVPELARVPARFIHEPWRMTRQDQEAFGCVIGREYPRRIVDHAEERAVTRALYSGATHKKTHQLPAQAT